MAKLNISSISHERVSLAVSDTVDGVLITVTGDIDMQDPSKLLDPFFLKLHQEAVQHKVGTVAIDFRPLNFLNSSGIKALAKWAMALASTPGDQRYHVKMHHNKAISWQATSLPTLTFLVPGSITLV